MRRKSGKGFTLVEAIIAITMFGLLIAFCMNFNLSVMKEIGVRADESNGVKYWSITTQDGRHRFSEFAWWLESLGNYPGQRVLMTDKVVTATSAADFDLPAGTILSGITDGNAPGPMTAGGTQNLLICYDNTGRARVVVVVSKVVAVDENFGLRLQIFDRNKEQGDTSLLLTHAMFPGINGYTVKNPLHASTVRPDVVELELPVAGNGYTDANVKPGTFQPMNIPRVVR